MTIGIIEDIVRLAAGGRAIAKGDPERHASL